MKSSNLVSFLIICFASFVSVLSLTVDGSEKAHWAYEGKEGPSHWGDFSETCSAGMNQSPIDISNAVEGNLPPLAFNYENSSFALINNGHTVQANVFGHNTFKDLNSEFDLLQFHFHAPSENTINGQSFPLEVHFVHVDKDNNLAVIGMLFKEGHSNEVLDKIWAAMPTAKDSKVVIDTMFTPLDLVPDNKSYYRFNGSLTTPPCSEGVRWFVVKEPIEASAKQIKQFKDVFGFDTNRPIQPLNARVIVK